MQKVTQVVELISHILNETKPLLFDLTMYFFGVYEMGKFIWTQIFGGH